MKKIGLFYGPTGGSTERVAQKIAKAIGEENVDLISVKDKKAADVDHYENIIFGISTVGKETWDAENPPNDWDLFLPEVEKVDYSEKKVAIFGLGDQVTYDLHFVDAMGILARRIMKKNANIVGQVDTEGYDFRDSEAIFDDKFIGLPVNEDFEPELTEGRIEKWLKDVLPAFH